MKISREFINFNKEFIFGELGAVVGAPLASLIGSYFTESIKAIALITVIGAAVGASLLWLAIRIYDRLNDIKISKKEFMKDLAWLVPVSSLLAFSVYYPSLYMLSKYLLEHNYHAVSSAAISQISAYVLFLLSINGYRYLVMRFIGRNL